MNEEEYIEEAEGEGEEERDEGTEGEGPNLAEDIANIVSSVHEDDGDDVDSDGCEGEEVAKGEGEGEYRSPGYSTMYAQLYTGTGNNTVVTGINLTYKGNTNVGTVLALTDFTLLLVDGPEEHSPTMRRSYAATAALPAKADDGTNDGSILYT